MWHVHFCQLVFIESEVKFWKVKKIKNEIYGH